ncbi:T9SS type A sorting domain-containing protein [Flavobacterium lindanitolerans]|uniref:T9SS type A sorting domain-containing protein n=1 Tax=Flavobacterium lindanitolerans TaxID=428988 RepID=UPI0031E249BF
MKKITHFLCLGLISFSAFAQDAPHVFGRKVQSVNPTTGIIRCVSSEYESFLQENNPKRTTTEKFEEWLAPKVAATKSDLLARRSTAETNAVITIPVVVHVIHSGQSVGNGRNISDARVISQITVLNQDFRRMLNTPGYNTNPIGADVEVEFCLAKVDPNGNATTGIDRVNLGTTTWNESNVETILKPQTIWDPTRYFNIWVCQFGGDLNGVLGYAQFPLDSGLGGLQPDGTETEFTDGVIIEWRAFGSSDYVTGTYFQDIDKGRTTTHEVGHFLGLRHIWGDNSSCTVNATDSFNDYCPDTPAARAAHYDCAQEYDTCTAAPGKDMTENYMDYSNDLCMNIFTLDQKARIKTVLQNSPRRNTLGSSTVCQPPLSNPSFQLLQGIKLYPNPANDVLNIAVSDSSKTPDSYTIYNSLGQAIKQATSVNEGNLKVDTSNYATGIYMIRFTKGNETKTLQFVKN